MERETIIERVRKLLALSTSDNQYEAELALKKASELMEQHQLNHVEVEIKETQLHGVTEEDYTVDGLRMKYMWVVRLGWAAAKLFDCEVADIGQLHGTRFRFIGGKSDIEMAKITFEHLYRSWQNFVERDLGEAKKMYRFQPRDTMKFKQGHGQGYASALFNRATKLVADRKAHVQATVPGRQLVVLKDQLVRQHIQGKYGLRKSYETRGSSTGYGAGRARGNSVALGGEIGG
jgi:hypothetical protein